MQYDFNLSAGGGTQLAVRGKFVKYKSGTGMIRVGINSGGFVDLLPGQGIWGIEYSTLNVSDKSGVANSGIILAGEFDFHDDRITGTVDVVDGGKDRTLAGITYFGYQSCTVGTAGNHPFVQLLNPAGSGKNVYVKSLVLSSTSVSFVGVSPANVALTNLARQVKPKRQSMPDGVTQVRYVDQAGYLSTYNFTGAYLAANSSIVIPLQEPLLLEPGYGIGAGGSDTTVGASITLAAELLEIAQ